MVVPTTHQPSPPDKPSLPLSVPVAAGSARETATMTTSADEALLSRTPTASSALAAAAPQPPRSWIVQKYGGTSVGKFLPRIAQEIAPDYLESHRLAIVCSARSGGTKAAGTTSLLLLAAEQVLAPEDETPDGGSSLASSTNSLLGGSAFSRSASRSRRTADLDDLSLEATEARSSPSDKTVDRIRDDHIAAARKAITRNLDALKSLERDIEEDCERLRDFLMAAKILEEISPRSRDIILSVGERLSCRIVAGALVDAGVEAEFVGLENIVDAAFLDELSQQAGGGGAGLGDTALEQGFYDLLSQRIGQRLNACKGTPVVTGAEIIERAYLVRIVTADSPFPATGYFGNVPGSLLSQVGRGYTDLCAALCAVGVGAEELQIWKEVDGVFTADPRKVPTARLIPSITPEEASELTYYGSEVIHPFTMEQAIKRRVPIRIKNVENPGGGGTVIFPTPEAAIDEGACLRQPETPSVSGTTTPWGVSSNGAAAFEMVSPPAAPAPRKLPTAVTIKDDVWVLNVHSNRKTLSQNFFARIFGTLDKHGIVVDLISTSEVHVSMALTSTQAGLRRPRALDRVKADLSHLGTVSVLRDMAILSLVGTQMRHMVGVAGKMFSTLAEGNVNIEVISQGANEINISCVIHQKNALKALNLIHYSVLEVSPVPANRDSGTFGRSFF